MLKANFGNRFDPFLDRTSRLVLRMGLRPNTLTFIGLGLNGLASWALAEGEWLQGAALILLAGFSDILDGAMARNCNTASLFGSFLDSVVDRYSDMSLLVGLMIFYSRQGAVLYQVLIGLSLMGTALVPYTRARAENFIAHCNVGILERPERILLIYFGVAIPVIMPGVLWALAVLTNLTVVHRVLFTWRQMKNNEELRIKNKE